MRATLDGVWVVSLLPVVLLLGPTASGKSSLSLQIAADLDVEIISVDSAQVYRGMDIGTAKPDAAQRAACPHHLLDILDPAEAYSAARFRDDALRLIAEIRSRNRLPLLVGGTMLYFHALTQGISRLPAADAELRKRLSDRAAVEGWPALHVQLERLDPQSAQRLHPNDGQRILRALEIVELTGGTVAAAQDLREPAALEGPVIRLALWTDDRKALHERIAVRFAQMMQAGFLEEVRGLRSRGDLHRDLPAMRAVGYRQLWSHLDGDCDLSLAVDRGIAATRQLAKRQYTWLRSTAELWRVDPGDAGQLAQVRQQLRTAVLRGAC